MRRALLVGRVTTAASFTVGQNPLAGAVGNAADQTLWVSTLNPAPRAGVLTTIAVSVNLAGNHAITILTGTRVGTTFTVKQRVDLNATTSGLNTFTGQSLPIAAGDLIAFWCPNFGTVVQTSGTGASGVAYKSGSVSSVPTIGQNITVSADTGLLVMQATGS